MIWLRKIETVLLIKGLSWIKCVPHTSIPIFNNVTRRKTHKQHTKNESTKGLDLLYVHSHLCYKIFAKVYVAVVNVPYKTICNTVVQDHLDTVLFYLIECNRIIYSLTTLNHLKNPFLELHTYSVPCSSFLSIWLGMSVVIYWNVCLFTNIWYLIWSRDLSVAV